MRLKIIRPLAKARFLGVPFLFSGASRRTNLLWSKGPLYFGEGLMKILLIVLLLGFTTVARADETRVVAEVKKKELWLITAYCSCKRCCGKSDGITASGKKVRFGYIALNWLPFYTKVEIEGLGIFTVMDRGAKSLFGSKKNPIEHIDIYLTTHKEALKFGKQYRKVKILK